MNLREDCFMVHIRYWDDVSTRSVAQILWFIWSSSELRNHPKCLEAFSESIVWIAVLANFLLGVRMTFPNGLLAGVQVLPLCTEKLPWRGTPRSGFLYRGS